MVDQTYKDADAEERQTRLEEEGHDAEDDLAEQVAILKEQVARVEQIAAQLEKRE